jgi:hypothetical protein
MHNVYYWHGKTTTNVGFMAWTQTTLLWQPRHHLAQWQGYKLDMCSLLPGRDRVLFSSPEHPDWLLWLFRSLLNGAQVQILKQALIPTPTQTGSTERPKKSVKWPTTFHVNQLNVHEVITQHIFLFNLKISARLTEMAYCAKHASSFFCNY